LNHFVDKNGDILVFWHFYSNHSQSRWQHNRNTCFKKNLKSQHICM
jgi:hypothetical protein